MTEDKPFFYSKALESERTPCDRAGRLTQKTDDRSLRRRRSETRAVGTTAGPVADRAWGVDRNTSNSSSHHSSLLWQAYGLTEGQYAKSSDVRQPPSSARFFQRFDVLPAESLFHTIKLSSLRGPVRFCFIALCVLMSVPHSPAIYMCVITSEFLTHFTCI